MDAVFSSLVEPVEQRTLDLEAIAQEDVSKIVNGAVHEYVLSIEKSAEALVQVNNYRLAASVLQRAVSDLDKMGALTPAIEGRLTADLGDVFLNAGDVVNAERAFLRALELGYTKHPNYNTDLNDRLGDIEFRKENYQAALSHYNQSKHYRSELKQGMVLLKLGEDLRALRVLLTANSTIRALYPGYDYSCLLAEAYFRNARLSDAEQVIQSASRRLSFAKWGKDSIGYIQNKAYLERLEQLRKDIASKYMDAVINSPLDSGVRE